MPKRMRLLAIGVGMSAVVLQSGAAYGSTSTPSTAPVTATITSGSVGSRVETSTGVSLVSAAGSATLTGTLPVTVAEAAVTGDPAWSVTASVSNLSDGATPTPHTIANSHIAVSGIATTQTVANQDTLAAETGTTAFSGTITLIAASGEASGSIYTNTFNNTSSWSIDASQLNGQAIGAYTGTVTLTLVQ